MTNVSQGIRPTVARIDLRALTHNLRQVRSAIGPGPGIMAVVKADAYGHGAVAVARLLEGLGVWGFGVATVEEGVQLRRAGIRLPVIVMGAAFGDDHREVIAHDLLPMVGDPGDIDRFAAAAQSAACSRFAVHVKIDTGMTRLGVSEALFDEFVRRCARYPWLRVDGLATHFYAAEERNSAPTLEQLAAFLRCIEHAREMGAVPQLLHAANSAAALRFPATRFDLVRVGILLYGARPSENVPTIDLRPALSWSTRINAIREVPAGTSISYGGSFVTSRVSRIATLPVGYADGYARALSNRAQVLVRGKRAPVVGQICMDLSMVDISEIEDVEVGDSVTLLGCDGEDTITPDDLGRWSETIPYEVLARISWRVPREYPDLEAAEVEMAGRIQ